MFTQIAKSQWQPYLDQVSKATSAAERVEVQVASPAIGDQLEASWIPLLGVSYDPKDDVVSVAGEGLEHLIAHPKEIEVDREATLVRALVVVDGDGARHIVRLRDPLALPSAS